MGSMISGVGNIYQGVAGLNDANAANQREWNTNDALAQYQARLARQQGNAEVGKIRAAGGQTVAEQNFAYSNSGVDASVGTAAQVQANTAAMSELDAQTAANNAARQAWGFKVAQEQAHQTYINKQKAAQNQAVGSVLTGAGQLANGVGSLGG